MSFSLDRTKEIFPFVIVLGGAFTKTGINIIEKAWSVCPSVCAYINRKFLYGDLEKYTGVSKGASSGTT